MKPLKLILTALVSISLLGGCASRVPVQDIHQEIIGHPSSQQIKQAILVAGLNRGWIMYSVSDGIIEGKLQNPKYSVTINVIYNNQSYQIKYISSNNLDAKNGKIHSSYSRWVANLNKDIQVELARQNITP